MNAVDTNILIYAADTDDGRKGPIAVGLLDRLANDAGTTVMPWQVLCEFMAFLAKACRRNGAKPDAFEFVRVMRSTFRVVTPNPDVSNLAIDIHLNDQVSIWDVLLLAACVDAGVTQLFTEDMQSKPVIRGVRLINPFV